LKKISFDRFNLQGKFFLYFSGLVVLVVIFFSAAIFYFQKQLILEQAQEKAFSLIRSLAYTGLNAILLDDYIVLQSLIDSMMDGADIISISILDTTGRVIASSTPDLRGQVQFNSLTRDALSSQTFLLQKVPGSNEKELWDTAVPIYRLNQRIGTALMQYSLVDPLKGLVQSILSIGFVAIVFSLILAHRFSRSISKPISEVVCLAAEYGKGNLDASIKMKRNDEVGELVESLNKMSHELKNLIEEKIANENLVMMGEFASYIIHDLKNPLSGIYLLSDGLHRRISDDNPLKKYATEILLAAEKLHDFVERTLDVAKWNKLNLKALDVSELIHDAIADLDKVYVKTKTKFDPAMPRINADYQLLLMTIKNLLTNAVEACNNKGEILISTDWCDNQAIISVCDSGCGIPEDRLKTIFRPFFSLKKKGHGLGLAMVRKAVILHQGKVDVQSREGVGSTFTIYLPGDLTKPSSPG
jgi:signal transduction histidine kinase